jgi:hypothetical protein
VTVCFVHKFNCEIGDLVECNEERLLEEATAVYRKTRSSMKDCITKKQDGEQEPEDYRVFVIKRMGKPMSGLEFLRQNTAEIAGLMRQERDPGILSEEEVARSVKNSFSFYKRDLAVIGYLDALIVEPEDETDAVLTLEIANIELLKLRIYDRLLDRYLEAAYHDLREVSVSRLKLIFMSRRLGRIARAISEAKAETSELIGNVMNMSRFIGDWYTGRIYSAVAERLHLKDWEQEVVRKIDVLEEAYTMIFDKINSYQLIVLEVLVVLLIVFEIVMSLMKWA